MPTIVIMFVLAKFWKSKALSFVSLVLKALVWVTAVLAGSLFANGYTVLMLDWRIGVPLLVLYALVVLTILREIRLLQHSPKFQGAQK